MQCDHSKKIFDIMHELNSSSASFRLYDFSDILLFIILLYSRAFRDTRNIYM